MRKSFLIIGMSVLLQTVFATSYTANQNGNWSNSVIWTPNGVPAAGDDVIINNGYTITLTADAACANLTHSNSSVLALGAYNLSVSGNLTFNCSVGTFTASTGYVILNGTSQAMTLCGSVTIPNLRLINSTSVSIGVQNDLNITGNFDCQTGSSTFTDNTNAYNNGKLSITGTCTAPNCTFTIANDHVAPGIDFSNCTSNPVQVGSVVLSVTGSTIVFGSKNVTYMTAFSGTNTAGITFTSGVASPAVATYYSKNSTDLSTLSNWNTNIDGTSGSAPASFSGASDLFIVQAGHACTMGSNTAITGTLTVNGTLTPAAGAIISGGTLNGSGIVKVTRTSATADFLSQYTETTKTISSLTVDYSNSSGSQTISAVTYNNLTLSNTSGTQTAANNLTVTGTLTMAAGGTLAMGSYTLGTPTSISMALTSQITGSGAITLGGDIIVTGAGGASAIANPIVLTATRTFTIADGSSLNDLTLNGIISGSFGITKAGAGNLMLSAANTNTGVVTAQAGLLTFGSKDAVDGNAWISIWGGAVLDLNGFTPDGTGRLQLQGTGISSGGSLKNSSATPVSYTGQVELMNYGNDNVSIIANNGAINLTSSSNIINSGNGSYTTINLILGGTTGGSITGAIENGSKIISLTKQDAGVWTLNGSNTYTGTTVITAGTLRLGAADRISNSSNMQLNGGTFSTGATTGYGETLGTLNLNANSTIALGTGSHTVTFANSSAVTWAGSTLTITGWTGSAGATGTAGKIFFGSSTGTLTAGQLSKISFTGYAGTPILLSTGELIPPGITPPTLTAAVGATVDGAFTITYTTDDTWKAAITSITVDGTTLAGGAWSKTISGQIVLTPSASTLLQTNGSKAIVVIATGYNNATVTQAIAVGNANKLVMKTQPAAPSTNGAVLATQPAVYIQDQYGNATTSTATVVASATSGLWSISGTNSKAAVSGTATFTDLTASYATSVSNATITFTSTGLTSVTSGTFNIPSPPSVALASASQVTVANIQKGAVKQALSAFTLAVTTANATLTQVVFTTAGTYSATDVTKYQLWYKSSNDLSTAVQIGSDITTGLAAGSHTFSGLSQSISSGATGYFWITTDVYSSATNANTINVASIANSDVSFVSGSMSGSATAGAIQTIVNVPITYYSRQSGNWTSPSTWSTSSCGNATNTGTYPGATDNVTICNSTTITLDANSSCASLILNQSSTLALAGFNFSSTSTTFSSDQQTISGTGNGSNTLSLGGNLTLTYNAKILTTGYNVTIGGNLDVSNSAYVSVGAGNVTIVGNFTNTVNRYNARIDWTNGTVLIGGSCTVGKDGNEPFNCTGTGWLEMNGTSKSITLSNDISLPKFRQPSSSFTKAGSYTMTVSNIFDRNCGVAPTVSAGTFTITVPGNTINATCGIPDIALSSTNLAVTAASIAQSSTKNAIYKFTAAITTNSATLTSLAFTTTNTDVDVTKYQLWYKTSDDLSTATQIGSDITTSLGSGTHTFSGFSQILSVNTTAYFWITTNIAGAATVGHTISVSAITTTDITVSAGNKTGTAYAGGVQTIAAAATLTVSTASLTGFYYVGSGPSRNQYFNLSGSNLLNGSGNITVIAPTNYIVCNTSGGTYGATTTIAYSSATLAATPVYVRLKSGLTAGTNYNSETITFSGGGYAGSTTVSCTGGVGKIFYLKQTGNWNQTTTWWVDACNGSNATAVPAQYDSVVCGCNSEWNDKVLTITADASVGGVKIDRLQDFIFNSGITFTVNGNLQLGVTGTWTDGQGKLNVGNGTLVVNGDLTLGYNNDSNGLKWDNGNIYVGGNLICADGGGPSPLDPGSDAPANTSLKPGGTTPTYVGAIIMTGTNKTINVSSAAVDLVNLQLQSSTISKTGSGILYITGNLNLNSQTAFDNAAGTLQVTGTITNGANAIVSNEAILKIATTTNTISSISASGATNTVTYFSAGGTEPVPAGDYYNLIISGGGTKVLLGDVIINNILTFDTDVTDYIDLSGHTLTMNNWANGNIVNANTSRYVISNNGIFTINGVGSGETANFPIGLSTSSADFCRVDIANSDAAHTSFSVTGICNTLYTNGTCDGAGGGVAISQHAVNLTWFITSLSTNAAVTFYWDQSKELTAFDRTNCGTMHYGTFWEQKGSFAGATNYSGTIWSKSGTFTSFSPGGVDDPIATMLPIELSAFTAKADGGIVKVKWSTLTETNNDYFTLERSIDGQIWEIINMTNGAGTSTQNHTYSYVDNSPFSGKNYYRLKQTDINGDYSYSTIQSAEINNENLVYNIYPNPSIADEMLLYIKGYCVEIIAIEIEDVYGRQVCSGSAEISKSPVEIKVSDLCLILPGTYFITIKGANFIQNKKVVIK